ncbi:lactate utilization protein [Candidatus Azambacteria bacterium]|nr:lactate utilization protein [Candidatus Azambacteria bacterium]
MKYQELLPQTNIQKTYDTLADRETVQRTIEALKPRGIEAELLETRADALRRLQELIPNGVSVMTGGSTTLDEIGFTDLLISGKHPWKNLKDAILAEKDPVKQAKLRKESVLADYFLGSAHAVAETGEIVWASASGSQLPAYAFTSDNIIWIVGTQKITPTLEEGLRRVREYTLPLEDARMKSVGFPGSTIGRLLIFEREIMGRNLRLLFVNEVLGF